MATFPAWITLGATTNISTGDATINGTYGPDSNGYDIQTPITLYYGKTTNPITNVPVAISGSPFSKTLTGLDANTLYYVYAKGWNGLQFSSSPEITFTTSATIIRRPLPIFFKEA